MVKKRAQGFTYLTALFVVAILAGGLALAGTWWEQIAQREREAELLFIGHQYRRAIGLYYDSTPGSVKRYPAALDHKVEWRIATARPSAVATETPSPCGGAACPKQAEGRSRGPQSLYGSTTSRPAIATPSGRSRCFTRTEPACAASTSGRRL